MFRMLKVISTFTFFIGTCFYFSYYLSTQEKINLEASLPVISKVKEFKLTDQNTKNFYSNKMAGKVWVSNFIFTNCQGPCPINTKKMAELQREFNDAAKINFLSITMDPHRDTPEQLKSFAENYHVDFNQWSFLTGEKKEILYITKNIFKVPADEDPINHSTRFVLIDTLGSIRGFYEPQDKTSFEKLRNDIKALLNKQTAV
ncbi:MAG: cytochrome c oxidase assembly protein [Zetaproteobacteria bacterium]|nr:cytochrome c oxidase assembly protein [Pseudobdellovibrionaceae bacterium]|tara:strand:+ start:1312 stop:1917 length:606 start_codon:yes stop_codon:yes gene_type:complete